MSHPGVPPQSPPPVLTSSSSTLHSSQELSLLDYGMLRFEYSTIAAAALVAAHRMVGGTDLAPARLRALMPALSVADVARCASAMAKLHIACSVPPPPAAPQQGSCSSSGNGAASSSYAGCDDQAFLPLRQKYCGHP